ncbi:MAG: YfcE family phosphodiesterase [Erysipelotrichaceae bacterium]|nr:YfcE family phosphodiesterase [Erysipelotrichaceae bacterium]
MRILLVSDSHGNNEALDELIAKWPNIDLYLHAGDSESHPRGIYPFRSVRGNCDYSFDMQEELLIPTPFGNILMRHKKEVSTKKLDDFAVKVFIYGHTHVPECVKRKGVAFINPGSISYPRSEFGSTYMVLDLGKNVIDVKLYSLENDKILKRYRVSLVEAQKEEQEKDQEIPPKDEVEELERQLAVIEQELTEIRSKKKK